MTTDAIERKQKQDAENSPRIATEATNFDIDHRANKRIKSNDDEEQQVQFRRHVIVSSSS